MVDDMCFIRSMHTEAINHEPAITLHADRQPGHRPAVPRRVGVVRPGLAQREPADVRRAGRPAARTPSRCRRSRPGCGQSATCPASTPACRFRTAGDPILYINNPPGVPADVRRKTLDGLKALNELNYQQRRRPGDAHAHPAVRAGLPHAVERAGADRPRRASRSRRSSSTATTAKKPGTFANTALLARRLVERGVRFVQIYHNNWDTHANVAGRLPDQCRDVDQPCYGLIQDLKQRGMLDETLVIWGGEFGRTIYSQGGLSKRTTAATTTRAASRCGWPAAASRAARSTARPTTSPTTSSRTRSTSATSTPPCCTCSASTTSGSRYRYQGLDQKLTGVEPAQVIKELLA